MHEHRLLWTVLVCCFSTAEDRMLAAFQLRPAAHQYVAAASLGAALLTSHAAAQLFADPYLVYEWHSTQNARTISNVDSSVLCDVDWDLDRANLNQPWQLDESLNAFNGGCSYVVLFRRVNYNSTLTPTSATLYASSSISASTDIDIDFHGRTLGAMSHVQTLRFRALTWVQADLLLRFVADLQINNANVYLEGRFRGPIDPLTDNGVLFDTTWAGSTRRVDILNDQTFAPGVYELNLQGAGTLVDVASIFFTATTIGGAQLTAAHAIDPPADLDRDQDGWVGLSDACLWADQPNDANQDGQTNQADLELILAYARAGGEEATDSDADGHPEQCTCPGDWNGDGSFNFFDVQAFLAAFSARLPSADLNGDGTHNFFDVQEFLSSFSLGC